MAAVCAIPPGAELLGFRLPCCFAIAVVVSGVVVVVVGFAVSVLFVFGVLLVSVRAAGDED